MNNRTSKNKILEIILCSVGFIGIAGLHRFYVGKTKSGLLYLLTFGVFGIGTIIDLISLLKDNFADVKGSSLEVNNQPIHPSQTYQQNQMQYQQPQAQQTFQQGVESYNQANQRIQYPNSALQSQCSETTQYRQPQVQQSNIQQPTNKANPTPRNVSSEEVREIIDYLTNKKPYDETDVIATMEKKKVEKVDGEYSTGIEFNIVGVTFEDRQDSLEWIYDDGVESAALVWEDFEGEDAIRVYCNDLDIGHISRKDIKFFKKYDGKITYINRLFVGRHEDYDTGELTFYAKIQVRYYAPKN